MAIKKQLREVSMNSSSRPLKWHKFLCYFALWLSAILNFFSALAYFNGSHYAGKADTVYEVFPGMKSADSVYGVFALIGAVLAVLAAINLIRFMKLGPTFLYLLYIVNIFGAVVYMAMTNSAIANKVTSDTSVEINSSLTGTIIGSILFLAINFIYYGKRRDLFTN